MTRLDRSRLLKEAEPPPYREHVPTPTKRKRYLVSLLLGQTESPAKKRSAITNQWWNIKPGAHSKVFYSPARLPTPKLQASQIDQSRGGNFRNTLFRNQIDPAAARSPFSDWKASEGSWLGSPVFRSVLGPEHTSATKSWSPSSVETPLRFAGHFGMSGSQHRDAFRLPSKQSHSPFLKEQHNIASVKQPTQDYLNYQQLLTRKAVSGLPLFHSNGENSTIVQRGGVHEQLNKLNNSSTELQLGSGVSKVPDRVQRESEAPATITQAKWGVLLQEANNPCYSQAQASRQEEIDLVLKQKEISKLGFEKAKAELQKRKDASEALAEKLRKGLVVKVHHHPLSNTGMLTHRS